jgi:hypothetical protein
MYYIGLDVHKKTISYCVKDASGQVHQEGKVGATRRELDQDSSTTTNDGHGSNDFHRLDLRSSASARAAGEGGASCEDRNHRREAPVRAAESGRFAVRVFSEARVRRTVFPLDKDLHGGRRLGNLTQYSNVKSPYEGGFPCYGAVAPSACAYSSSIWRR